MVTFQPVRLEDREWALPLLRKGNMRGCQYSFANIFAWGEIYHQRLARQGDYILIESGTDERFYLYPCGEGDLKAAFEAIFQDSCAQGKPPCFWGITQEQKEEMERLFPGKFAFEPHDHTWDYLYNIEKLATLAGKKLHGKRNHINRFLAQNQDWRFEPLNPENILECREMNRLWRKANDEKDDENMELESMALRRVFDHYEELEMEGGLLRVNGQVVAFTMGSRVSDDTFDVQFEKALTQVEGAYPMINREFARYIQEKYPDIVYLNREEDMGEEGLRKAKQSYYPDIWLEKYEARPIGGC